MEQSMNEGSMADSNGNGRAMGKQRRKVPSAQELVSHYESQGLSSHEASMKVIEDLQNALVRVISSGRGRGRGRPSKDKLDAANARLAILDLKLDSKPGYAHTLALGVASASLFSAIGAATPHVFGALSHIWTSATNLTKHSSP